MSNGFRRQLTEETIEALEAQPLFVDFLKPDIARGEVFPAVRANRLDFYHRGGKLFSFSLPKGFATHQKYVSILPCHPSTDYVCEADLIKLPPVTSFSQALGSDSECTVYSRIKENCALYSEIEAKCVSVLYSKYSFAKPQTANDIVVLDVEVAFRSLSEAQAGVRSKQDRIDLLLLNRMTGELRFVEAKHFTNSEVRSQQEPRIVKQIGRYRSQLSGNAAITHILGQYENHVSILNRLFHTDLPAPLKINPEPQLYLFGFDDDQKNGRLQRDLKKLVGVHVYAKGDPKDVLIHALWSPKVVA